MFNRIGLVRFFVSAAIALGGVVMPALAQLVECERFLDKLVARMGAVQPA